MGVVNKVSNFIIDTLQSERYKEYYILRVLKDTPKFMFYSLLLYMLVFGSTFYFLGFVKGWWIVTAILLFIWTNLIALYMIWRTDFVVEAEMFANMIHAMKDAKKMQKEVIDTEIEEEENG